MTHSYRHTPIFGHCVSTSSKKYKTRRHRQERARVRQALFHGKYEEAEVELAPFDDWDDPRDGRVYYSPYEVGPKAGWGVHTAHYWKEDPEYYEEKFKEWMRK